MIYRIMEVNTEDDSYKVIYGGDKHYRTLKEATLAYAENNIYPKDKERFIRFFYAHRDKIPETADYLYYRRMLPTGWQFACIEIVRTSDPIVLLVVRDVEDDMREFFSQFKE